MMFMGMISRIPRATMPKYKALMPRNLGDASWFVYCIIKYTIAYTTSEPASEPPNESINYPYRNAPYRCDDGWMVRSVHCTRMMAFSPQVLIG